LTVELTYCSEPFLRFTTLVSEFTFLSFLFLYFSFFLVSASPEVLCSRLLSRRSLTTKQQVLAPASQTLAVILVVQVDSGRACFADARF
jgi:hypothetical protein